MMKFSCPKNMTAVSVDGIEYKVVNGVIETHDLSPENIELLNAHGIVQGERAEPAETEPGDGADEPSVAEQKQALAAMALDKFGVVLDRRKSLAALRNEVAALEEKAAKAGPKTN